MANLQQNLQKVINNSYVDILVPGLLDFDKLAVKHPPAFKSFNPEFCYYVVGLIGQRRARLSRVIEQDVPLNAKKLQSVQWNYENHLRWLLNLKVIESNGSFLVGKKSRCYSLGEKYQRSAFKVKRLVNKRIITAIKDPVYFDCIKKYPEMVNTILDMYVDPKAYLYFEKERDYKLKSGQRDKKKVRLRGKVMEFDKNPYDQYYSARYHIDLINYRLSPLLTICDYGRFHNNISMMGRKVRHFLNIPNEPSLCMIDMSNAQFYLLSQILANLTFFTEKDNKISIYKLPTFIKELHSFYTPIVKDISLILVESKFKRFLNVTVKGTFYDYFVTPDKNRDKVKEELFPLLFSCPHSKVDRSLFTSKFPEIWNIIAKLQLGRQKALPGLLQAVESYIMLDLIYPRLIKEMPGIRLVTVHDAMVTTADKKYRVMEIMKEVFIECFGTPPNFKVTDLIPEALEINY